MTSPFGDTPALFVTSPDGTRIAAFDGRDTVGARRPLLLVHGTGSDHTTWRVTAPLLEGGGPVHAMDRRGRGASGDNPLYRADREVDDIAAVSDALAGRHGGPIVIVGHSLGGRLALAATLRTGAIAAVVAYESAPPVRTPDEAAADARVLRDLEAALASGDHDAVLERFMRGVAGLPEAELTAFRASDLWPRRAATAPQIVRELAAARTEAAIDEDHLARVTVPVLQLVGTASPPSFREGAASLGGRLAHGRLVAIEGARHNAHHTHPSAFVAEVERFLAG